MSFRLLFVSLLFLFSTIPVNVSAKEHLIEPYLTEQLASHLRLSPDGKHLALIRHLDEKSTVVVIKLDDSSILLNYGFRDRVQPFDISWANNERLIIEFGEKRAGYKQFFSYGELYAVNLDGTRGQLIFGYRNHGKQFTRVKTKEAIRGWAQQIIDTLPNDKKHILLSYEPMSDDGAKSRQIIKLNVYNGKVAKRIRGPELVDAWFVADANHQPIYAWGSSSYSQRELHRYYQGQWHKIQGQAIPLVVNENGFLAQAVGSDGLKGLYQYNEDGLREKLIYQHKVVDVESVLVSSDRKVAYAAEIEPGFPGYAILNKSHPEAISFYNIIRHFGTKHLKIVSSSQDGSISVVRASSETDRGTYYLYDRTKDQLRHFIGWENQVQLPTKALIDPITFASFDGTKIHGYISDAESKSPKPLVVYVHGGPHGVRDSWEYDPRVQILGANGYRVLQVNYRGSGGYGSKFLAKGYRQWGDAIQKDIIAGVEWAIGNNYATEDNVCIIGASFGAYSALQSSAMRPDLFKCALGLAGVYDLPLMFKKGDIPDWVFGDQYLKRALGDDLDQLTRYSPTHNAHKLKADILLVHGTKDERTPIAQAKVMRKALQKANIPHEYVELRGEGHGIFDSENRLEHYKMMLDFLDRNLKTES